MKKSLLVLSAAALTAAGVATLTSCGGSDSSATSATIPQTSKQEVVVSVHYKNGEEHYGVTYQSSTSDKDLDGNTLTTNTMLPSWKAFGEDLGLTIKDGADYSVGYADEWTNRTSEGFGDIDIMMCDGKKSNTAADSGKCVSVSQLLREGRLPNFQKWLDANDPSGAIMASMAASDGEVYYTPYFDGLNNMENFFLMNTEMTEKLLDDDTTAFDTTAAKTSNFTAKVAPMVNEKLPISVNGVVREITVNISAEQNIITRQNALQTKNGQTYTEALKAYIDEVYGEFIGEGKVFAKRSEIFTSQSACYNADELVALMRCVQNNPVALTGGNEIYAFAPRAAAASRNRQIYNLCQMWGVRGSESKNGKFYFDATGNLVDGRTQADTYDALENLHELYLEGIFPDKFYNGYNNDTASDTYRKQLIPAGKLFMGYDFSATSSTFTSDVKADSKTNTYHPVLPPMVKWNDGNDATGYYHFQETNRAIKAGGWSIITGSDNIVGAAKLMDYMWCDKGADIQDFGPNTLTYRSAVTQYDANNNRVDSADLLDLGSKKTVKWSQTVLTNKNFLGGWNNFCRKYIGSTQGIGHQRSDGVDFQATVSQDMKNGLDVINTCKKNGTLITCLTSGDYFDWKTQSTKNNPYYQSVATKINITSAAQTAITGSTANTNMEAFWKEDGNNPSGYTLLIVNGWGEQVKEKCGTTSGTRAEFEATFADVDAVYLSAYQAALR